MKELPFAARLFVFLIWGAGFASIALSASPLLLTWEKQSAAPTWELFLLVFLGLVAGANKLTVVRLGRPQRGRDDTNGGSINVAFAIVFVALLRFGIQAAMLVEAAGILASCLWPWKRRYPWFQLVFNICLNVTGTFCAGVCFLGLNKGTLDISPVHSAPAVVLSALIYFLVNSGGVATVIGLATHRRPLDVFRESFLWSGAGFVIGALILATALYLLRDHVPAVLLCAALGGVLTYLTLNDYKKRNEELLQAQQRAAEMHLATVRSLALAIDAKDRYTHQHILRVQQYAVATARRLGLTGTELECIETGALLHDIGKIGVPESILNKPGRLTSDEFDLIRQHPRVGAEILAPVNFPPAVIDAVKYHHERWDGSGYPDSLRGEAIPLTARILAVADVYDALTSDRSYRGAWSHESAIEELRRCAGLHFAPPVVEAFLACVDDTRIVLQTSGVILPPRSGIPPVPPIEVAPPAPI